jgi:hypothetical protein
LRWEFYAGGMFGLLLGFVLRVNEQQPDTILTEAIAAGLRSVVWFAAYALLEAVPWTAPGRVLVLSAGVAALLVNLTVSGGIGFVSVAGPMWTAVALALATAGRLRVTEPGAGTPQPLRFVTLPAFAALTLAYLAYVFFPVTTANAKRQLADANGQKILETIASNPGATFKGPIHLFKTRVTALLDEAAQAEPDDARTQAVRGEAYGQLFELELMAGMDFRRAQTEADTALAAAVRAQRLDPGDPRGYLTEYSLRQRFARLSEAAEPRNPDQERRRALEAQAREQYRLAAAALARYLPHDPTNPVLRYQLAQALTRGGDAAGAREQAAAALALDDRLQRPTRRLTDPQRQDLRKWEKAAPAG